MKRALAILLAAVMLSGLSACGKGSLTVVPQHRSSIQIGARNGSWFFIDRDGTMYTWGTDICNITREYEKNGMEYHS